jgi:hypothetical protein
VNITDYQLKTSGVRPRHSHAFYMDATKFSDIVDFWNLRAIGGSVMPIPKQFLDVPEYVSFVRDYVLDRYRVHPMNPAVQYGTNIVRSYSSTMAELQAFATKLAPTPLFPEKPDARVLALQHWYPRVWNEWAMGKDGAIPQSIFSSETKYSFADVNDTASFDFVKPPFVRDTLTNTARYANEIYPRFYGEGGDLLADVLPYDHGDEVLRAAGGVFYRRSARQQIGRVVLSRSRKAGRCVQGPLGQPELVPGQPRARSSQTGAVDAISGRRAYRTARPHASFGSWSCRLHSHRSG